MLSVRKLDTVRTQCYTEVSIHSFGDYLGECLVEMGSMR